MALSTLGDGFISRILNNPDLFNLVNQSITAEDLEIDPGQFSGGFGSLVDTVGQVAQQNRLGPIQAIAAAPLAAISSSPQQSTRVNVPNRNQNALRRLPSARDNPQPAGFFEVQPTHIVSADTRRFLPSPESTRGLPVDPRTGIPIFKSSLGSPQAAARQEQAFNALFGGPQIRNNDPFFRGNGGAGAGGALGGGGGGQMGGGVGGTGRA